MEIDQKLGMNLGAYLHFRFYLKQGVRALLRPTASGRIKDRALQVVAVSAVALQVNKRAYVKLRREFTKDCEMQEIYRQALAQRLH